MIQEAKMLFVEAFMADFQHVEIAFRIVQNVGRSPLTESARLGSVSCKQYKLVKFPVKNVNLESFHKQ